MSRKTLLAAVTAMAGLLVSGCSQGLLAGSDDGAGQDGPVILGMAVPMSGTSADIGPYMKNGAQLAIDEINAKGGVLGRDLELRVEDDACDPKTAVAAANKLVTAKVAVSVGGYCSGATLPTLPVFAKAKIPMVIPAANSDELYQQGIKSTFLINGTGTQQADAALAWMEDKKAGRVAVVHDSTSYAKNIATLMGPRLKKDGGPEQVAALSLTPGESDYSGVVGALLDEKPDFVYWTGYDKEGGLLVRQLRQAGYKGTIMVADGAVSDSLAKIAGSGNADGVLATMTQTPDTIKGGEKWVAAYRKKFGARPGPFSTQSYDAVRVAAEAIGKAGSTESADVVAELEGLKGFPLFSGPLTFTKDHTLSQGGFVVLERRGGRFVLADSGK
ncbi:branched chain amino acid ABC transporter substrate-binding protein [Streptomyces agglomeratus]|uniref:Branched chain amino acid ABC transporter substrate-binding protein n=1 Tax=Streptomyces agglomeratus TaxID=285458 RepID=A0A1E5P4L2_9ACTN|nr:branched-chain amino acid ABC transporter substrate-binding protein [Streptomyces agglomeratus]OEJ24407.1 branched chain amino acid ABC transporter substrate-binding protein [Streptomyces agglomeratus]OEJ41641.1 branched chain amino acid ABC transporter substrate-binding protein [Streptomyces agglomeratus]OEJ43980.1 branched chain amino acid ABC transporter substrate-binding protein [Streptomyces agglomeratus]OEJ54132.1 branched chain amino acid ABC transporter substrate-binding protein [Str